jgi:hypothetical protein
MVVDGGKEITNDICIKFSKITKTVTERGSPEGLSPGGRLRISASVSSPSLNHLICNGEQEISGYSQIRSRYLFNPRGEIIPPREVRCISFLICNLTRHLISDKLTRGWPILYDLDVVGIAGLRPPYSCVGCTKVDTDHNPVHLSHGWSLGIQTVTTCNGI